MGWITHKLVSPSSVGRGRTISRNKHFGMNVIRHLQYRPYLHFSKSHFYPSIHILVANKKKRIKPNWDVLIHILHTVYSIWGLYSTNLCSQFDMTKCHYWIPIGLPSRNREGTLNIHIFSKKDYQNVSVFASILMHAKNLYPFSLISL